MSVVKVRPAEEEGGNQLAMGWIGVQVRYAAVPCTQNRTLTPVQIRGVQRVGWVNHAAAHQNSVKVLREVKIDLQHCDVTRLGQPS